jgi:hypothetical protein
MQAVIKSYYDGPLSASLHNVHQSAGFIAGQTMPTRADSGVSLRSTTATAVSESNLLTLSQSPPSNSPPLHHPPASTLPLKNNIYGTGKFSNEDLLSHLDRGARVVEDSK